MSIETLISGLGLSFIFLVPLSIKWELEKKIVIPAALLIGISSWIVVEGILIAWSIGFYFMLLLQALIIATFSIILLMWRFFRDPERIPPDNKHAIISPADGTIIYVKKIESGEIPLSEKGGKKFLLHEFVQSDGFSSVGYLVGIAMNYLDVHVNRAPIGGRVSFLKHIKGLFISLKKKEAVIQNERVITIIENGDLKVGIVQIASRLVRKIIPYLRDGDQVTMGQRIGAIRFGSQVDLVLPETPHLKIQVGPGDKVKAGLSIVASFENRI